MDISESDQEAIAQFVKLLPVAERDVLYKLVLVHANMYFMDEPKDSSRIRQALINTSPDRQTEPTALENEMLAMYTDPKRYQLFGKLFERACTKPPAGSKNKIDYISDLTTDIKEVIDRVPPFTAPKSAASHQTMTSVVAPNAKRPALERSQKGTVFQVTKQHTILIKEFTDFVRNCKSKQNLNAMLFVVNNPEQFMKNKSDMPSNKENKSQQDTAVDLLQATLIDLKAKASSPSALQSGIDMMKDEIMRQLQSLRGQGDREGPSDHRTG